MSAFPGRRDFPGQQSILKARFGNTTIRARTLKKVKKIGEMARKRT